MFSSSLRKAKGIYDFAEVIQILSTKYPEVYFVLAGSYSENIRNELEQQPGFPIDKVKWTGFRSDIVDILHTFDIAVYPSHSEGLPNALLEQMACRLPTVGYDISPMNYLIKDGFTGYTAPFEDRKALAQAVEKLIVDEKMRNAMGKNAYKMVKENHDISQLDDRFQKLFEDLFHG